MVTAVTVSLMCDDGQSQLLLSYVYVQFMMQLIAMAITWTKTAKSGAPFTNMD